MTAEGPVGVPSAEDVERARADNTLAQVLYHDWEAQTYDEKWSISFDERCVDYARDRFVAIAGEQGWPYATALEVGAGTGFFSLNLKQAGVLDRVHVTDLSPGMVEAARQNAARLGFRVEGSVGDAEQIPFEDSTFDVVVGHAVLHHVPDVEQAMREMLRVLRPGGRFVIAGEPTRIGDRYARALGRATWKAATAVTSCRRCAGGGPARRRSSTSRPGRPRWRPSSTCTPSTRTSWPARRCEPAPSTSAPRPRS